MSPNMARRDQFLLRGLLAILILTFGGFAVAQDPNVPPRASATLGVLHAEAGSQVKGEVVVRFAPGLHGYQNPPSEDYMIPVVIKAGNDSFKVLSVEYPAGKAKAVGGSDVPVLVYSDEVRFPVTIQVPEGLGEVELPLVVSFQQCDDDTCFMPSEVTATARLTVLPGDPLASSTFDPTPTTPERSTDERGPPVEETAGAATEGSAAEEAGFVARMLDSGFRSGNYFGLLIGSLLTGLLLALTPCVYPVIPITVSFFSNQTGGSRAARTGLGLMYMLGIGITYGFLGGVAAALGGSVGELFTRPWFLFGLSAFMIVLALSMFGVYEIGIPPAISKHLKGRSGAAGALIMGLLVGVAAAPCAGALVSTIAIEVARIGQVPLGVLVFTAIGFGIGLPFVALAAAASGTKSMPKSGAWLKTIKAVLGIVVLWIAMDYLLKGLGFRSEEPRTFAAWAAFYIGAAIYLFAFENSGSTKTAMVIKGAAVLALGILGGGSLQSYQNVLQPAYASTKIPWQTFTPESFEAAKVSGKPIFIDATADWCVKCKELERKVFNQPRSVAAMEGVIGLKIDWSTGVDPAYIEMTRKQFGIQGLPHFELFAPGGRHVETRFDFASVDEFIAALQRAGAQP
jgi:thioredoxin:protein disulfide reductase